MSEPDETIKPWPPVATGQQAIVAVLASMADLFLTMPDLPAAVEPQLRRMRSAIEFGDPAQVKHDAITLSSICEREKRNLGR